MSKETNEEKLCQEKRRADALLFDNVQEVKNALSQIENSPSSLKESLLRCYLLNLILYKQVNDPSHPVKNTLITLSVYIDLLDKAKKADVPKASNILQEDILQEEATEERKPISFSIEKNKPESLKRSKARRETPRLKNKRRYEDAHALAKKVRDTYPVLPK
ncbi:hypothetical protein NECID01_0389 [Nematocida sp. AWRm77]|nr:hypothetical protein NECID01_0389 [Nematocida sp. AWRm77]